MPTILYKWNGRLRISTVEFAFSEMIRKTEYLSLRIGKCTYICIQISQCESDNLIRRLFEKGTLDLSMYEATDRDKLF